MTKHQFKWVMSVLWLIAANTATEPKFALACAAIFAGFAISLLFSGRATHIKGEQS